MVKSNSLVLLIRDVLRSLSNNYDGESLQNASLYSQERLQKQPLEGVL